MDAKERAAIEINDREEGLRNKLIVGPLYIEISFLERDNFVRYLVAILLH